MSELTRYLSRVASGTLSGHTIYKKWGTNRSIAIGSAWIWSKGGDYSGFNDVAEDVLITSSSAQDGVGGTGWIKSRISYLDGNGAHVRVIVDMDGATGVLIPNCLHVFRMDAGEEGAEVGSAEVNIGNITATGQTSGNVLAYVVAGDGGTLAFLDVVPDNHRLEIYQIDFTSSKTGAPANPVVVFDIWTQINGFGKKIARTEIIDTAVQNYLPLEYPVPWVMESGTRWWTIATTDKVNTVVSASMLAVLVKE